MAKYTIELNTLMADDLFNLFDFEYNFYSDEARPNFEQLFKDYFRFREIGFETVPRFKHELKSKLNLIMPYYTQLYETEVKSKDINFLLNKDLKETFTRELTQTGTEDSSSQNSGTDISTNTSSTEASSNSTSKESYLDNGNADINLTEGNLTGVSGNNSEGSTASSSSTNNTISSTGSTNTTNSNNETESTTLLSQGNIGITSSAELLQKWRDTIININHLIISECEDLFMQLY